MKLLKGFLSFFKSQEKSEASVQQEISSVSRQEIDRYIDKDELLVRIIVKPLMFNKNKLAINSVLPKPGERDVSLIRHKYKDDLFCKLHGKSLSIPNSDYCGLAVIKEDKVAEVNSSHPLVKAEVIATPLDINNNVREDWPIYIDDLGVPAHGSIMYDTPPKLPGEPNPLYILFAKALVKRLKYFPDPDPNGNDWQGERLTYNEE